MPPCASVLVACCAIRNNHLNREHQDGELIISIDQLVLIVGQVLTPSIDG